MEFIAHLRGVKHKITNIFIPWRYSRWWVHVLSYGHTPVESAAPNRQYSRYDNRLANLTMWLFRRPATIFASRSAAPIGSRGAVESYTFPSMRIVAPWTQATERCRPTRTAKNYRTERINKWQNVFLQNLLFRSDLRIEQIDQQFGGLRKFTAFVEFVEVKVLYQEHQPCWNEHLSTNIAQQIWTQHTSRLRIMLTKKRISYECSWWFETISKKLRPETYQQWLWRKCYRVSGWPTPRRCLDAHFAGISSLELGKSLVL